MPRPNLDRMVRNGPLAADRLRDGGMDHLLIPSARAQSPPANPPVLAEMVGAGLANLDGEPHLFVRLVSGGTAQDVLLPLANAAHGTRLILEVLAKAGVEFERAEVQIPKNSENDPTPYGPEFASVEALAIAPFEGCDAETTA